MRYAASATVLLAVLTLALWPMLEREDRPSVALAALVALAVQIPAFSMVIRARGQVHGFLGAMVGGMALRALAVIGVAAFLILSGSPALAATLLALVSFLFALLVLEFVHFKSRPKGVA
jgi:hypothetical protein